MPFPTESLRAEESRLQQAYARRRNGHLYSRFNPAHLLMVQEREKRLLGLLSRHGCESLERKKILEIGCGNGDLLRDFVKWGARPENIVGIDLLPERVAEAIHVCPKVMEIHQGNAAILEFEDASFDLVIQSTVFTSVLDINVKRQMASEMCRVLKPDGFILWYDYHVDNPKNSDVKGVKRREIHTLFPKYEIQLQQITLAPPIARLLAPYCWLLCCLLSKVPWLCTHYIGVIHKGSSQ
jgi:ubiquinone/menaquinone biosynthesis C-methylase UbiE